MPNPDKPSLLHPLAGADLTTFLRQWAGNFPFPLRTAHIRVIAALCVAVRIPKVAFEHLSLRRAIARQRLGSGPVMLVGHWRSGTTHLHNLLSQDPRFGWMTFVQASLPWDCLGKFRPARFFIKRVMPATRGMDDVSIGLDTPQEEEMALANMNRLSFFNSFYFPRHLMKHFREAVLFEGVSQRDLDKFASTYRYLVQKFSYANDAKPLLLKNPANTGRLAFLKQQFPNAKFVHIVRNPYEVYASMQKLWQRLFAAFSLHNYHGLDTHTMTLEIYESLTKKFLAEQAEIPADDFIELRFENVERDPVGELARVYDHFSLPDRNAALEKIRTYAETLRDYKRSQYELPTTTLDEIRERWGFALDHWGYDLPDSIKENAR